MGEGSAEYLGKDFDCVVRITPFQCGENLVVDLLALILQDALTVEEGLLCGTRVFDLAATATRLRLVRMVAQMFVQPGRANRLAHSGQIEARCHFKLNGLVPWPLKFISSGLVAKIRWDAP